MDPLISARNQTLRKFCKIKITCYIVDFAILSNHRKKVKESVKKNKYLDIARRLSKLWNMNMTVIGALETMFKGG